MALNKFLTKENIQMINKHLKRCFTSYDIKEMKTKNKLKNNEMPLTSHQLEWSKPKAMTTPNGSEDVRHEEFSFIAYGNAKLCSHFGRQLAVSYKLAFS